MSFDFDTPVDRNGTGALKWDRRSAEEKRLGVVPMSIADMEFRTAPCVIEAVQKAAAHGLYGYTDPEERYFAAVQRWMKLRHGMEVAPEQIVCASGVVPALSVGVRAFTKPGEGVAVFLPGYYPFRQVIEDNGRRVVPCDLVENDGRYTMDLGAFDHVCERENVKLLLFCSPHNPVGRVWTQQELDGLMEICLRRSIIVLSDEIHFDLILSGRHVTLWQQKWLSNVAVATSASKTFNLAGLQLCNVLIADKDLRRAFVDRLHADGYSNITCFGWAATVAAYEGGEAWTDELCAYLRANKQAFDAFFAAKLPKVRMFALEGTYLAWTDWRALDIPYQALDRRLREEMHLVLDEGRLFGEQGKGFERFNIALPKQSLLCELDRIFL